MSVIGFLEILYFIFVRIYKNYVLIRTKGSQATEKEVMEKIDSILLGRHNKILLRGGDNEQYQIVARKQFTPSKKI